MTNVEKAKFLLKHLSSQKMELSGAREAFSFVQSYQWLVDYVKSQEEKIKTDPIPKVENGD